MILNFIKQIVEFKMLRPLAKYNMADVFYKFNIVGRVLADVSPQYNFACLLIHLQAFQHQHNIFYIVGKLLDGKLIVINKFACGGR